MCDVSRAQIAFQQALENKRRFPLFDDDAQEKMDEDLGKAHLDLEIALMEREMHESEPATVGCWLINWWKGVMS